MQQIIISGVGGQGILFITKLLAETALSMDYAALISETHGMAQRGGNVISHLKVHPRSSSNEESEGAAGRVLTSPLIRPGKADVLLALHPDALGVHSFYLKPGGAVFASLSEEGRKNAVDAQRIATELGSPVSANLVLLGFAAGSGGIFCSPEQIEETLKRLGGKRLESSLQAFNAGRAEASKRN